MSITDFARRTGLSPAVIAKLAEADAFGSLALDRRGALWQALAVEPPSNGLPLLDTLPPEDEALVSLPEMPPQEQVFADYRTTELSLRKHPMAFHREWLKSQQIVAAEELGWLPNESHGARGGVGARAAAAEHGQGNHVCHAGRRNRRGEPDHPTRRVAEVLSTGADGVGAGRARAATAGAAT